MQHRFRKRIQTVGAICAVAWASAFAANLRAQDTTLSHIEYCAIDSKAGSYVGVGTAEDCIASVAKRRARERALDFAAGFARQGCGNPLANDVANAQAVCRVQDPQANYLHPGRAQIWGSLINGQRPDAIVDVDPGRGFCGATLVVDEPQVSQTGARTCGLPGFKRRAFKATAKAISACGFVCRNPN